MDNFCPWLNFSRSKISENTKKKKFKGGSGAEWLGCRT